uniref:SET domain-containing protein n=1 Tax=Heterorhabditis bacteriophora TaxID=37862 RepID=A0A1I7W9X1_HETBA
MSTCFSDYVLPWKPTKLQNYHTYAATLNRQCENAENTNVRDCLLRILNTPTPNKPEDVLMECELLVNMPNHAAAIAGPDPTKIKQKSVETQRKNAKLTIAVCDITMQINTGDDIIFIYGLTCCFSTNFKCNEYNGYGICHVTPRIMLLGIGWLDQLPLFREIFDTICCILGTEHTHNDLAAFIIAAYPNVFKEKVDCCTKAKTSVLLKPDSHPIFIKRRPLHLPYSLQATPMQSLTPTNMNSTFIIDVMERWPDPEKIAVITKIPKPQNINELQSFLRMITYYTSFVPNMCQM